jgi:hypothetical protein
LITKITMKNILLLLLFISTLSCSLFSSHTHELKKRNLGEYFQNSEVVRYLLPPLPEWANASPSGKCSRTDSINYLKLDDLMTSFSLSYAQAVQFQYMYNIEAKKLKEDSSIKYLPFKENEKLFYAVSDRIKANIYMFIPPKFKRVHLIWIDNAVSKNSELKKLKRLMTSSQMGLGHPVFVSLCLSKQQLEKFHAKNNFNDSVKMISYEFFSPFSTRGRMRSYESLNFAKFLNIRGLKLYLYQSNKNIPDEFVGKFKTKFY